jgi:hypothetical protein
MKISAQEAQSALYEAGRQYPSWFSGRSDGLSTIIAVLPYAGRYREHFTHVLRLSAPGTNRGWMEMAVNESVDRMRRQPDDGHADASEDQVAAHRPRSRG